MMVSEAFEEFTKKLELTKSETDAASRLHSNIREVLRSELNLYDDFLTGSYARNTKIRPLSDIDLFAIFDRVSKFAPPGQGVSVQQALAMVKSVLGKALRRYPSATLPKIQNRSVGFEVNFPGKIRRIGFDIVPAFEWVGRGYLIPDLLSSRWISSDPNQYASWLTRLNSAHNGNLIPLIKMLKKWNQNNGEKLKSYHLELLVVNSFSKPISNYQTAALHFFGEGDRLVKSEIYDPIVRTNRVDDYLTVLDRLEVCARLQASAKIAGQALLFSVSGNTKSAISRWNRIFGEPFPRE